MELSNTKVHFIGVGGIGMSGLAELFFNLGAQVSGSDLQSNAQTEHLKKIGVTVFIGHSEDHVSHVDVVVHSSAVAKQNIEYKKAKSLKIPCIPRAEALAEIMRLKKGIAIAGTHGKTTTTSLIASIFLGAHQDPTIVVGGRLDVIQSTAKLGQGEWLIAEADESDGSFLKLNPRIGVITNIDQDHMDFYKNFYEIQKSFLNFSEQIPFYGCMVVYGDDPQIRTLFQDFSKKIIFYGFDPSNDFVLKKNQQDYQVEFEGKILGSVQPNLPGAHNALNSLASIVVGLETGLTFEDCKKGIENFSGVGRRFEYKGKFKTVDFYDDYGHHPTEIKAVIQAFKERFADKKLMILFEPHRYSRTQACWKEFLTCFEGVDHLVLMDTYSAGESVIKGAESKNLYEELIESSKIKVSYLPISSQKFTDLLSVKQLYFDEVQSLLDMQKEMDLFLTLGAGKVNKIGEAILHEFRP